MQEPEENILAVFGGLLAKIAGYFIIFLLAGQLFVSLVDLIL